MPFRKYMHIERYGKDEVQGIELGECFIFPKIDGSNGSVWYEDGQVQCGSRNRQLSLEEDNQGFMDYVLHSDHGLRDFVKDFPSLRLYGEWLVPHSLRTYREDAWRKFYVFDVYDDSEEKYLPYKDYIELLQSYTIHVVLPSCVMKNSTYDALLGEVERNTFLVQDGAGAGEGIVVKNYSYENRFGRTTWAKIVRNEFKEKLTATMGATVKNMKEMTEAKICDRYVSKHLVDKVFAKIANEMDGWNSKYIPRLFNTVYHDLVTEELWDIVKDMKHPTINFKALNSLAIMKVKELKPELF